jgi:4'-phosphopantetheinyl transferase
MPPSDELTRDIVTGWRSAPSSPLPPRGDVHVWRARLDVTEAECSRRRALLDDAERARALSYRLERDRRRFTVARGFTRAVLAVYERTVPNAIRFRLGPHGKPALQDALEPSLCFSVSYSGDIALVAVSDVELGVDVERVRDDLDILEVSELSFSRAEHDALRALPPSLRRDAFFACWTRKEAYTKATGLGLTMPLRDFSVSLAPDEPAALLEVTSDPRLATGWTLQSFDAGPEYACALAFRARDRAVSFVDA